MSAVLAERVYGGGLKFVAPSDPILKERMPEVPNDEDGTFESCRPWAKAMIETMREGNGSVKHGVGLAAPQVGIRARMFVADFPRPGSVFINPQVLEHNFEERTAPEGCLSFPGRVVPVKRWTRVKVAYFDLRGARVERWLSGLDARIFQHEDDHLDGICKVGA